MVKTFERIEAGDVVELDGGVIARVDWTYRHDLESAYPGNVVTVEYEDLESGSSITQTFGIDEEAPVIARVVTPLQADFLERIGASTADYYGPVA
jgi:hypothetical protein